MKKELIVRAWKDPEFRASLSSEDGYWLRHFASQTPGVKLVEALPYLRAAAAKR